VLAVFVTAMAACSEGGVAPALDATVVGRADVPSAAPDAGAEAGGAADGFACPETWVRTVEGGCGPAVLLCGPDGGAAPGACAAYDPTSPERVVDPDGVEGTRFYRLPDGGIGGGWSTPWVCPTGWTNAPEGHCQPTLREDCPRYSGPLPDGTCTPTDEGHCPVGGWPEVPAEAAGQRVVYVRTLASLTPDGSREAPYPDLNQAVAAQPEAEWFVLFEGDYSVEFAVHRTMHVLGACAPHVRLTTRRAEPLLVVDGPSALLDVRGVTLGGGSRNLSALGGAHLRVRECILQGASDNAIVVAASTGDIADCVVGEQAPASLGYLIAADPGGLLTARRISTSGRAYAGFSINGATSRATIEDCAIRGVAVNAFDLSYGARVQLHRIAVVGTTDRALRLVEGAHAEVDDLWSDDATGASLATTTSMIARRVTVERARGLGMLISGANSEASVDQFFLRGARSTTPGMAGGGVSVDQGAHASLRRGTIVDCEGVGLVATLTADADLRDSMIRHTTPTPDGLFGIGIAVNILGSVTARRVLVEGASMVGVGVVGLPNRLLRLFNLSMLLGRPVDPTTRLSIEDVIVRDAHPLARYPAFGLGTAVGGSITGRRVSVDHQPGVGIAAADYGFQTDVLIANVVRANLIRSEAAAALRTLLGPVLDGPSSLALDGVFVRGTRDWRISYDPDSPNQPLESYGSFGLYAGAHCSLAVTHVTVDGSGTAATGVASLGEARLDDGLVVGHAGCAMTLNTSISGASIARTSVTLSGNARNAVCPDDTLPSLRLPLSPN
jgi:hypothetical protein